MRSWKTSVARAGSVPSGQSGSVAQVVAMSSKAFCQASNWVSRNCGSDFSGSTAPSMTIARRFCGNAWAYIAPSSLP